jgi:hypothetical protein
MTWMIEAMSQFEIPRPTLRSSVWPRQVPGTSPPGTVPGGCSFHGYGTQHPGRCNRYFLVASGRNSVVSRLRAAMAGAAMNCCNEIRIGRLLRVPVVALERKLEETGR